MLSEDKSVVQKASPLDDIIRQEIKKMGYIMVDSVPITFSKIGSKYSVACTVTRAIEEITLNLILK